MGFDARGLLERGRTTLSDFTAGQKTVTALIVVVLIAGGYFFSSWASKPNYTPLFSNLAPSDASAITDKLAAKKEPYKLTDGGTTILVPPKDVYQLRIDLSSEGLPTGGVSGYSLLDKQGITSSEFQQNVAYQRALEGELTKTIEAIDGVNAAVVHLVIPKQDVFTSDDTKASASVLVKTPANKPLTTEQVQAVVHLVSSSVQDLSPDNVTVADSGGHVLTAPGMVAGEGAGSSMRAEQTAAYQDRVAQAVQDMLSPVVGAGHAVVRVSADIDYDSKTTQSERYVAPEDPNVPPLSESTSKETYTGNGTPSGGVLGPDNIAVPNGADGSTDYSKEEATRNNAVGRVVEQVETAPGAVKRMSVAVLLDEKAAGSVDTAQVQQMVANAAGTDTARGDTVSVSTMPFDETAQQQAKKELAAAAKAKDRDTLKGYVKDIVLVVVGLLALFLGLRRARKSQRTSVLSPTERLELDEARRLLALQAAQTEPEPAAVTAGTSPAAPAAAHAIPTDVTSQLGELVERQPEEVAQLLRGWLADRRS